MSLFFITGSDLRVKFDGWQSADGFTAAGDSGEIRGGTEDTEQPRSGTVRKKMMESVYPVKLFFQLVRLACPNERSNSRAAVEEYTNFHSEIFDGKLT